MLRLVRPVCVLALALVGGFAAVPPALAVPHLSKARSHEISTLVNRFVNDVVRRQDLADGWRLAGPELRGGTTRAAWVAGRAVPVERFPVRGRDFRKAWYPSWVTSSEIGLVVSLRSGRGKNAEIIEEQTVLTKRDGRWVVNAMYPNGIFRLGKGHRGSCPTRKCAVTGLNDFKPGPSSGGSGSPSRIGTYWLWLGVGGIAGMPLAILLGTGVYVARRNRRARAAYLAARSSTQ
jgi:hypothetical protein